MTHELTLNEPTDMVTGLPLSKVCDCSKCSKTDCERRTGPTENTFHDVDESNFASFGPDAASYMHPDGSLKTPESIPDTPQRTVLGVDETRFVKFGLPSDPGYKQFLETT